MEWFKLEIHYIILLQEVQILCSRREKKRKNYQTQINKRKVYRICRSAELKIGQVDEIKFAGRHIAYYRGTDKVVYAVAAYCPHMGANLGIGGQVKFKSCIECPFHGWAFDGKTGLCVNSEKLDPKIVSTYCYNNIENMDTNKKGEYLQKIEEGEIKTKLIFLEKLKEWFTFGYIVKKKNLGMNLSLRNVIICNQEENPQTILIVIFKNFLEMERIFDILIIFMHQLVILFVKSKIFSNAFECFKNFTFYNQEKKQNKIIYIIIIISKFINFIIDLKNNIKISNCIIISLQQIKKKILEQITQFSLYGFQIYAQKNAFYHQKNFQYYKQKQMLSIWTMKQLVLTANQLIIQTLFSNNNKISSIQIQLNYIKLFVLFLRISQIIIERIFNPAIYTWLIKFKQNMKRMPVNEPDFYKKMENSKEKIRKYQKQLFVHYLLNKELRPFMNVLCLDRYLMFFNRWKINALYITGFQMGPATIQLYILSSAQILSGGERQIISDEVYGIIQIFADKSCYHLK